MPQPPCRTSTRLVLADQQKPFGGLGDHLCDLDQVACLVYLEHFDCNLAPLVLALPYFGKPTVIERGIHSVVAKWDLYRSWEQSLVAAYPAQCGQTPPSEPRRQAVQCLFVMRKLSSSWWTYSSEIQVGKYLIYHVNKGLSIIPA